MAIAYYVEATDGQEKRCMWDSVPYVLPAGEKGLFQQHIAEKFLTDNTTTGPNGEKDATVSIEPCPDPVEFGPKVAAKVRHPETGEEFASVAELLEYERQRIQNEEQADPSRATLTVEDLDLLTVDHLRRLAKERGVAVKSDAVKAQLIEALAAAL